MVEGSGSKTFSKAKRVLYGNPEFAHKLLSMITDSTINYLKGQVKAGADIVQIFAAITEVPVIVFAKGAYFARQEMNNLPCEVIGLDWNMEIAESRQLMPDKVLQGNLDPCALYGSRDDVRRETRKMIDHFGPHRHIANLGHGLYPDIDVDNVRCFIDTVKEYSASLSR